LLFFFLFKPIISSSSDSISESKVSASCLRVQLELIAVAGICLGAQLKLVAVAVGSVSLLLEAHGLGSLITVLIELQLRVARVAI
jgi:hypothetical protein